MSATTLCMYVVSAVMLASFLQGCGANNSNNLRTNSTTVTTTTLAATASTTPSNGSDTATTTTTTATPTTTTITTPMPFYPYPWPVRVGPPATASMTSAQAAAKLNADYAAFDVNDPNSAPGVPMTMVSDEKHFYGNVFCSAFNNPVCQTDNNKCFAAGGRHTACFYGGADCHWSFSLYSHAMMVSEPSPNGKINVTMDRRVGIILDIAMVRDKYAKCAYIWDGATDNKYLRGCGTGAANAKCANGDGTGWPQCQDASDGGVMAPGCAKYNAFSNINPDTSAQVTAGEKRATDGWCDGYGGPLAIPPTHDGHAQCAFPTVAIDWVGGLDNASSYVANQDKKANLFNMAKERVARNGGQSPTGEPNIQDWNEVVLDQTLVLRDIYEDPQKVVVAIGYATAMLNSRASALAMRDEFCVLQGLTTDCIPIVAINNGPTSVAGAPFEEDAK